MNTLENDGWSESAIWHDRMLQGCHEVIQRLTILLLRLKQRELLATDESTLLTVFAESCE